MGTEAAGLRNQRGCQSMTRNLLAAGVPSFKKSTSTASLSRNKTWTLKCNRWSSWLLEMTLLCIVRTIEAYVVCVKLYMYVCVCVCARARVSVLYPCVIKS